METIPFLTQEDVSGLDAMLTDYLQKSEAMLTVVIDRGGTVIAQLGNTDSVDITIIAALAAGSFAATKELASRIGEKEFSALYQQGQSRNIFMSAIDENTIIITIFGEKTTLGLVRFYTVNLSAQLVTFLKGIRKRDKSGHSFSLSESDIDGSKIFATKA